MIKRSFFPLLAAVLWAAVFHILSAAACAAAPATLTYQNRPIVTLRATLASSSPEDRVSGSKRRLDSLTEIELQQPVRLAPAGDGWALLIGNQFIVGIFPQDLDPAGTVTLKQVADNAAAHLADALNARREQKKSSVLLLGTLQALVATLVFVLIILGLARLRNWLLKRFRLRATSAQSHYMFLGQSFQEHALALLRFITRFLLLTAVVLSIYMWLTFVLRRFPYTYPWGQAMRGFFIATFRNFAEGIVSALPGLFSVFAILFLGRLATRAIKEFFAGIEAGRYSLPGVYAETAAATRRLINTLIWLFALVVAYPYFPGSGSAAFKGVSLFAGLMLSIGSAGVMNHLMSGLVLVYSRAFRRGDYIRVGDVEGTVLEIGPLSVKLATKKREELTIPNNVLTGSTIVNYSRLSQEEGLIVSTTVTIGYDVPWRLVRKLLLEAAARTSGLRTTPPPFVLQTALSDFYVEYKVAVSTVRPDQRMGVLSELHAHILDAFNESGIQIMSPHFESQPPSPVLASKEKWFAAPADESAGVAGAEKPNPPHSSND